MIGLPERRIENRDCKWIFTQSDVRIIYVTSLYYINAESWVGIIKNTVNNGVMVYKFI